MSPDVGRQVIAPGEGPHANPALERFLSGVNADVSSQLVRPGEASIAVRYRAGIRALVDRGLGRSVGVFPVPNWHQPDRQLTLLVDL